MEDILQQTYAAYVAAGKNVSEAARTLGVSRSGFRRRLANYFKANKSTPPATTTKSSTTSTPEFIKGHSRTAILAKHDAPTAITALLDKFISMMRSGVSYEEEEVRRFCKIDKRNMNHWVEIVQYPEYIKYWGYTETDIRLWGQEEEINWNEENITGFRRAV